MRQFTNKGNYIILVFDHPIIIHGIVSSKNVSKTKGTRRSIYFNLNPRKYKVMVIDIMTAGNLTTTIKCLLLIIL